MLVRKDEQIAKLQAQLAEPLLAPPVTAVKTAQSTFHLWLSVLIVVMSVAGTLIVSKNSAELRKFTCGPPLVGDAAFLQSRIDDLVLQLEESQRVSSKWEASLLVTRGELENERLILKSNVAELELLRSHPTISCEACPACETAYCHCEVCPVFEPCPVLESCPSMDVLEVNECPAPVECPVLECPVVECPAPIQCPSPMPCPIRLDDHSHEEHDHGQCMHHHEHHHHELEGHEGHEHEIVDLIEISGANGVMQAECRTECAPCQCTDDNVRYLAVVRQLDEALVDLAACDEREKQLIATAVAMEQAASITTEQATPPSKTRKRSGKKSSTEDDTTSTTATTACPPCPVCELESTSTDCSVCQALTESITSCPVCESSIEPNISCPDCSLCPLCEQSSNLTHFNMQFVQSVALSNPLLSTLLALAAVSVCIVTLLISIQTWANILLSVSISVSVHIFILIALCVMFGGALYFPTMSSAFALDSSASPLVEIFGDATRSFLETVAPMVSSHASFDSRRIDADPAMQTVWLGMKAITAVLVGLLALCSLLLISRPQAIFRLSSKSS